MQNHRGLAYFADVPRRTTNSDRTVFCLFGLASFIQFNCWNEKRAISVYCLASVRLSFLAAVTTAKCMKSWKEYCERCLVRRESGDLWAHSAQVILDCKMWIPVNTHGSREPLLVALLNTLEMRTYHTFAAVHISVSDCTQQNTNVTIHHDSKSYDSKSYLIQNMPNFGRLKPSSHLLQISFLQWCCCHGPLWHLGLFRWLFDLLAYHWMLPHPTKAPGAVPGMAFSEWSNRCEKLCA